MYTTEDFLKMLEEGKSAEDIAKEITDNLNAAVKEHEKKEALTASKLAKRNAAGKVADAIAAYLLEFHPDSEIVKEFSKGVETDTLDGFAEAMDSMVEAADLMMTFGSAKTPVSKETLKTFDDVLRVDWSSIDPLEAFLNTEVRHK